jgi:hypothetical protein
LYIFIICHNLRISSTEVRRSLSSIGINNSRVLDIHFPDRNKCGLLVHNDFVPDLKEALHSHGIKPISDFDPNSASVIRDPAQASASIESREAMAKSIQKTRVLRILARSPLRVRRSLVASFISSGTITYNEWTHFISPPSRSSSPKNNHVFFSSDDDDMEDDSASHASQQPQ